MLVLDLELEHLAMARQRGFRREAALELMLKHAKARSSDEQSAQPRHELSPVARFLANVAAHA